MVLALLAVFAFASANNAPASAAVLSEYSDSLRPDSSQTEIIKTRTARNQRRAAASEARRKAEKTLETISEPDTVPQADSSLFSSLFGDVPKPVSGRDTVEKRQPPKSFLEDIIDGTNQDSMVYDVRRKQVHVYTKGDLKYQNMNLKADYMRLTMDNKELFAYGVTDTAGNKSRPEFIQGGSTYTMDTISYNMKSGKAKIKGAATRDGEGYLLGRNIKKMEDNTINTAHGKFQPASRKLY